MSHCLQKGHSDSGGDLLSRVLGTLGYPYVRQSWTYELHASRTVVPRWKLVAPPGRNGTLGADLAPVDPCPQVRFLGRLRRSRYVP